MSTFETNSKIYKFWNDQQTIKNNTEGNQNVTDEDQQKVISCDKCTLLNNLKDTVTNIYNTTLKNEPKDRKESNFCELDIIKNFYKALPLNKDCDNCRKLKSETSVQSAHRRKKHKHCSGSQIDTRSKDTSNASSLETKPSRKSRSLSRNKNSDESKSDTRKEDVLKWKQEIETLEIKRQVFTAVGQNKPNDFNASKDKEKSFTKHLKKNPKMNDFNFSDKTTEKKMVLMNGDHLNGKSNFPKKEFVELDKLMKSKAHRRTSKKRRNNSPNLPLAQQDLEIDTNIGNDNKTPVPDILINLKNSDLKDKDLLKFLNGDNNNTKDKTVGSHSKSKNHNGNDVVNIENLSDNINEQVEEKQHNIGSKEIIDVFVKNCDNVKGSNDNSSEVETKYKRNGKDEHNPRKHKTKQTKIVDDKIICDRSSTLEQKMDDKIDVNKQTAKINNTSKMPLLFGVDYLMNSKALQKDNESRQRQNKEKFNSKISNDNNEDVHLKDRKEISFSNLNLSPIIDHYATNKSIIDSIFDHSKKKRHTKDTRSRLSDEFSIISDVLTSKERTIRRQRQDRAKHFFGSQSKTSRLINQTTNHLVSDENLIEVSTKMLNNDVIKSSVEGIEPPKMIFNKALNKRMKNVTAKNDSLLHMTFLEPVNFPGISEDSLTLDLPPIENYLKDKTVVPLNWMKELSQNKVNSLKLHTSSERKSKISVLYEHRSNSARRKDLRNKICKQNSKPNVVNNKSKSDGRKHVQEACTNPDLTRRVSFAKKSTKQLKCSKCHGTKKVELSHNKSSIVSNKKHEVLTTMSDKSISVNISGDTSANPLAKNDKKSTKKKSSKIMCTVDTQTDLIDYKNFINTVDDVCQTSKIMNVNKLCSPIIIAVPGIHKSDTNLVKNKGKPDKSSKDLKPSAYQKLQSAVMSIFENAKFSYEEEIEDLVKPKKDINATLNQRTNLSSDDKKIVQIKRINPPIIRPTSPIKPVSKNTYTKPLPPIKVDLYSARTRCNERSGIPQPLRKSQEGTEESKAKDCKLCNVKKPNERNGLTPKNSVSKLTDLKSLQGCIEDLISVLNDIKIRQPELKQRKDEALKDNAVKNKDLISSDGKDVLNVLIKSPASVDSIEGQETFRNKRRAKLSKHHSSASFDSNQNPSEIYLSQKIKSKQSRKPNRKKLRKSTHNGISEENKLRSVFKNSNCYGSSSYTQVSSSASDLINVVNENDINTLEYPKFYGRNFLDPDGHRKNNDFNFNIPFGVSGTVDSATLLMEQVENIQTQVQNDFLGIFPDILSKSPSPNPEAFKQTPEIPLESYKNIMEQLVYMFSQKPLQKNEEFCRNKASATTSSNFSADSLDKSYKYDVANKTMPPKNCDFFVYATTIELDDKDIKQDLTGKSETNNNMRTFTSFKNQNKLKSNVSINNASSRSSYNVASHDSGYATPGKKSASLKNFFKKGGSLLDIFKHKHTTSSTDTDSQDSATKCEAMSEISSQNKILIAEKHNEVIVGFSPAPYLFSLCPQKKNSLETVHEGVQASPSTKETSTMRKWTDFALNQSNQTKTPCQSHHSCVDQKCDIIGCKERSAQDTSTELKPKQTDRKEDIKNKKPSCNCTGKSNILTDVEKHRRQCKCKAELRTMDSASLDVANFILKKLLDNVADNGEQRTNISERKDKLGVKPGSIEEDDLREEGFFEKTSSLVSSNKSDIVNERIKNILQAQEPLTLDDLDLVSSTNVSLDNFDLQSIYRLRSQSISKSVDNSTSELVQKGPSIENSNTLQSPDEKTVDNVKGEPDDRRPSKRKSKSVEYSANNFVKQAPSIENINTLQKYNETIVDNVKGEEDDHRPSKRKSKSVELSTVEQVKQPYSVTDDSFMKANITIAASLSNKEVFAKMLNVYEKEDSVAERLSTDDNFFEKEVEMIRSNNELERVSSVASIENNLEEPTEGQTVSTIENQAVTDQKQKTKKNKFRRMFNRRKENVKQIMPSFEEDTAIKQKHESIHQIVTIPNHKPLTNAIPETPHHVSSKTKDMRFEEEVRPKTSTNETRKQTDCAPVEADDIGTCFARGFRPDNLALSGDACFNFNKQDKYVLSPNMTSTKESIIDFSERQTPLDYLLALGFMVDEASNALKDEDIRSRLLAAITEARVWINKITTTQGTLLYLVAYKTQPKTMRYFLQLVEAIINNRINNAIKLNGFLKVLERVEDGELQMINLLGADKFEDEENEEKIVKKQLRQLFATVYNIAEKEAKLTNQTLTKESLILLRVLAAKYRTGLHPHLELIASYIGQNLIKNEIQLEAAMIYLSRLDTADVKLKEFEAYCAIRCDENEAREKKR